MAEKKKRILVASAHNAYKRLFVILPGYDLRFVGTLAEAQSAFKTDGFSLILIGIYFEQSKMFELLKYVRSDIRYTEVPVACFRAILLPGPFDLKPFELRRSERVLSFDLTAFSDDAFGKQHSATGSSRCCIRTPTKSASLSFARFLLCRPIRLQFGRPPRIR